MAFPFFPAALRALVVLALAAFGAALTALDWTVDTARGSMLIGMVTGIRDWDQPSQLASSGTATSSPAVASPTDSTIETADAPAVEVVRVTPDVEKHQR